MKLINSVGSFIIKPYYSFPTIFEVIILGLFSVLLAAYTLGLGFFDLWTSPLYEGDVLSHTFLIKSVLDNGWYLHNGYVGAPYGLDFHDYPIPENGYLIIVKLLSYLTNNPFFVYNILILGSFFIVPAVSYLVLQQLQITKSFAIAGAILFTFIPFHFLRIGHLFYTWYFIVPIYILVCINLMSSDDKKTIKDWQSILLLMICASFGVYFAFFASFLLMVSGMYSCRFGNYQTFKKSVIYVGVISLIVLVNVAPNIVYRSTHGQNAEVANRSPEDAEIYGLRATQLVLPVSGHILKPFAEKTRDYNAAAPLVNENSTATLGLIGAIGFAALVANLFFKERLFLGVQLIPKLANLNLAAFLLGTIGGLGSLFALFISPMVRGYNRISVFIAFLSITAFLIILQTIISNKRFKYSNLGYWVLAALIMSVGIFDQIPASGYKIDYAATRQIQEHDRRFIEKIETLVPENTMIYQLPYIEFPERAPLYKEGFYGLLRGYLHSKHLKWSYGGMKGREGDLWLRKMSKLPIETQLKNIAASGFGGIYIDRRGFKDHGVDLENQLKSFISTPAIVSEDKNLAFYMVQPTGSQPVDLGPDLMLGKGFSGWEGGVGKFVWSTGDAELLIMSTHKYTLDKKLSFQLDTLVPRRVVICCGARQEPLEFDLSPGEPQLVTINIKLEPGANIVRFQTNVPAQLPGNSDERKLAFSLRDISVGD